MLILMFVKIYLPCKYMYTIILYYLNVIYHNKCIIIIIIMVTKYTLLLQFVILLSKRTYYYCKYTYTTVINYICIIGTYKYYVRYNTVNIQILLYNVIILFIM